VQCSAVQCSAVQCSAVQCSAVQCSAVQCSAVQCSAVQLCCRCQDSGALCNNDLAEPSEGPLVLSPTPIPPPCADAIFGCPESDSDNYNYDDTPETPEYDDEGRWAGLFPD
jgi:hypothetical protein